MLSDPVRLLPSGLGPVVEQINQIPADEFARISRRIFDAMPLSNPANVCTEDEKIGLHFDDRNGVSGMTILFTISELWKNIAYNQLKLQLLLESLKHAGFTTELAETIIKIWSESGLTVCDRLRDMSFSGRPNVTDISWTLRRNIASHNISSVCGTEAILQIDTDQGPVIAGLNRSKLVKLHSTLQEVQKFLDGLLKDSK